jgi:hypothetical protein
MSQVGLSPLKLLAATGSDVAPAVTVTERVSEKNPLFPQQGPQCPDYSTSTPTVFKSSNYIISEVKP